MKKIIILIFSIFLFANNLTPQEKEDAKIGEKYFKEILKKVKISKDKNKINRVLKVGKRLAKATNKDYDWEFVVVKDKRMNAFCLPGGKVVVFEGIFKVIENDDQLATVLSHEIGHAILRHGNYKSKVNYILTAPRIIAKRTFGRLVPKEFHKLLDTAYDIGKNLTAMLPFSRHQEIEADRYGIRLMHKAGYNLDEAIKFWKNMEKYSKTNIPEFLSTHPNHHHRIKIIKEEIEKIRNKK
jgi:predicted Zn-dependent protease